MVVALQSVVRREVPRLAGGDLLDIAQTEIIKNLSPRFVDNCFSVFY